MASDKPDLHDVGSIIVIGKTGSGKSATCNTILGTQDFKEGKGALPQTEFCRCVGMRARGRSLFVIDTPETVNAADLKRALDELLSAINQCPSGIDTFLLTFRCDVRATEEEIDSAEQALDAFGPECYKRAIVIFTHGSEYEMDEQEFDNALAKIRQQVPRLDTMLSKLDNKWVLLENRKCSQDVKEKQVMKLLEKAKVARSTSGPQIGTDIDHSSGSQRGSQSEPQSKLQKGSK